MSGLIDRAKVYDRRKLMNRAAKAREKGKNKRAIEAYQQVLEVEPDDIQVHRKLAPLLARVGQHQAAMESFTEAMKGLARDGFDAHALGVCQEATGFYPQQVALWEEIARLRLKVASAADAVSALLEGRKHLRRRKHRPGAIRLLERAHEIDRSNLAVGLDLFRLLKRSGRRDEAGTVLAELATRLCGRELRKVRGAQFRNDPSLRTAWAYLRSG
jgi:tetratricopeptide (TPR) repeat protein